MNEIKRTPAAKKAKQIVKLLRAERPDYFYLKEIFRHIRKELDVKVLTQNKKLPFVPSEEEIQKYYEAVWHSQNIKHMVLIKLMLYTGMRVGELIKLKIKDIDFKQCQIRINAGKGEKDRIVPFSTSFKEVFMAYIKGLDHQEYVFESNWKKAYTDRGIRKILNDYTKKAGISHAITPHKLRHFLFTWMKKQGVDDALIQPYSGHDSRKSLEIYSKLSITDAQTSYNTTHSN